MISRNPLTALKNALTAQRAAASELAQGLSEIRARIVDAQKELADVLNAPPDQGGLRERTAAVVSHLVREARERIQFERLSVAERDFHVEGFVAGLGRGFAQGLQAPFDVSISITPLHVEALIRPDDLMVVLEREASSALAVSDRRGMSAKDREAAIARLAAELDSLERAEEATCRAAEGVGMTMERRADADPRWLLATDHELQAA